MPQQYYDQNSGALLFRLTPEEKKEREYREKVGRLEEKVIRLENRLDNLENLLMEVNHCGKYIYS